jgi:hypothetical protein
MDNTREFPLGDILSITTGRLVAERRIEAVYDILNFMTRDNLFTHQLPRASRECTPELLHQHPELGDVDTSILDDLVRTDGPEKGCAQWVALYANKYGEYLPVRQMPLDAHEKKNPLVELLEMKPDAEVIVAQVAEQEA